MTTKSQGDFSILDKSQMSRQLEDRESQILQQNEFQKQQKNHHFFASLGLYSNFEREQQNSRLKLAKDIEIITNYQNTDTKEEPSLKVLEGQEYGIEIKGFISTKAMQPNSFNCDQTFTGKSFQFHGDNKLKQFQNDHIYYSLYTDQDLALSFRIDFGEKVVRKVKNNQFSLQTLALKEKETENIQENAKKPSITMDQFLEKYNMKNFLSQQFQESSDFSQVNREEAKKNDIFEKFSRISKMSEDKEQHRKLVYLNNQVKLVEKRNEILNTMNQIKLRKFNRKQTEQFIKLIVKKRLWNHVWIYYIKVILQFQKLLKTFDKKKQERYNQLVKEQLIRRFLIRHQNNVSIYGPVKLFKGVLKEFNRVRDDFYYKILVREFRKDQNQFQESTELQQKINLYQNQIQKSKNKNSHYLEICQQNFNKRILTKAEKLMKSFISQAASKIKLRQKMLQFNSNIKSFCQKLSVYKQTLLDFFPKRFEYEFQLVFNKYIEEINQENYKAAHPNDQKGFAHEFQRHGRKQPKFKVNTEKEYLLQVYYDYMKYLKYDYDKKMTKYLALKRQYVQKQKEMRRKMHYGIKNKLENEEHIEIPLTISLQCPRFFIMPNQKKWKELTYQLAKKRKLLKFYNNDKKKF
ncbi:hypothetical protein PPERSA_06155 [Pseudocohnilembus persalinus]|uniref:Uncharacterized protein n=1 Tax=Pseudocohnilembus persalinus TaxID=266149 RepID=A0A0V0QEH5_PSEPJ|nr:hypothetical protein PPERSA_06155 [Pseudocohnilembus persalinus]|eukprot:KRX00512.1 hypothetical protein PPERSA_06155 [Pseudocohnilembus persalinus]